MSKPLSVLILEDDDPLRQILVEMLSGRGLRPYAAEHAHQAMQMARDVHPDVGLFDWHLRGTTGLEVFLEIKREIGPMPAIMMSGDATRAETESARRAGVFEFLQKPIAPVVLQDTLDQLIKKHFGIPPG
jgi:DNA-binding NtrC family response regulator